MPFITARGIGVLIGAIIVFVLATYTRVGWLFMFDAVLWGTLVVSFVMPWITIGKLEVRRRVASWEHSDEIPGPMQNEPVVIEVRFKNTSQLPCVFVNARYNSGDTATGHHDRSFIAWLGKNQTVVNTTTVTFDRRGVHQLEAVRVQSKVPFGLFTNTKKVKDPLEIVILPKVYRFDGLDLLGNEGDSNPFSLQARTGEQVIGSRNYAPGDPWQHIHWRNTARLSMPQIKEFERPPDSSVVIGLDIRRAGQDYDQALEEAVSIAASVGDFICRSLGAVRLVTEQSSENTSDRFQLLTELAYAEGSTDSVLRTLPSYVSPFSDILAIVLDTDDMGIGSLVNLARGQHRVTAILMRGYGKDIPSRPAEALTHAGIDVVECWPGEVTAALKSLKRIMDGSTNPTAARRAG
jgi:uncharacterized protein (DUF58 family)